ncbi:MAG: hypothetical protein ACFFDN_18485, partial [Candidatus Hodarchaeota archaeon]
NQDIIDGISNRYFFVEDPISLTITNVPSKKLISEPLLHPSNPEKGKRKISCIAEDNKLNLLIASSDAKKFIKDQVIRLKDLLNVKIESINFNEKRIEASFHSKELNRNFSIIQWVPKDENLEVSIVRPDGSISNGNGEINLLNIPMNQTIQFERYGFVNSIKLEQNHLFCYFTH